MGMGGIAGGGAHRMVCSGGGVARPICSAPYGPSAEAKSARLTSWRATAARTVRVCAHLPRAFMHPGLGAREPCGASCSGGPALAYPISGGGASCHRPVPAASRFWARRDARSKGGVLSPAGGRTKQRVLGWMVACPSARPALPALHAGVTAGDSSGAQTRPSSVRR